MNGTLPPEADELLRELLEDQAHLQLSMKSEVQDRSSALVTGAYFDVTLGKLIRDFFKKRWTDVGEMRQSYVDEMFSQSGAALSTLSNKLRMAYALCLVNEDTAKDLDLIRKIRNKFAHDLRHLSFDSPEIKSMVGNLRILTTLAHLRDGETRTDFHMCAAACSAYLHGARVRRATNFTGDIQLALLDQLKWELD